MKNQKAIDNYLCDSSWAKPSSIPKQSSPIDNDHGEDRIVGVALNGVPFYSGTSELGYDAIFPKAYGNKKNPKAVELD